MTTLHLPCLSVATNSNSHFLLRVNYLDSCESYGAQLQVSRRLGAQEDGKFWSNT